MASYVVARLQGQDAERIGSVLEETRFWDEIRTDPFRRDEWLEAVRLAPTVKSRFHTVLSERDCLPEVEQLIQHDARLKGCFIA